MNEDERREGGFEYDGRFYPWRFSEMGKDLMLIDRIAGMGLVEFYESSDEPFGRLRPSILLTLVATSLRAGNPDWSVERIVRTVEELELTQLTMMGGEEEKPDPLAEAPPLEGDGEPSKSPSNGSSSSPIPTEPPAASGAWSEIPL